MSAYLANRLYRGTVSAGGITAHDCLLVRIQIGNQPTPKWWSLETERYWSDHEVFDVHGPLYVVELGRSAERIVEALDTLGFHGLSSQIEEQIPQPPRMAEPGWGEKVIAHTAGDLGRRAFVRWHTQHPSCWSAEVNGFTYRWSDLIDPEPES